MAHSSRAAVGKSEVTPVKDMDIAEVLFGQLPGYYSRLSLKEAGICRGFRKAWVRGLSDDQEKYARDILKRVRRSSPGPMIDEGDDSTQSEGLG